MPKQIFQQQEKESANAFEAAQIYFEMGIERGIEAVAQKLNKSRTIIARWSSHHSWTKRAKAYDAHLASIEQKAIDKTAEKGAIDWQKERNRIRLEALENSRLLIEKAKQMLQFPLATTTVRNGTTTINPARWSMSDAVKFVETADKLQRLAAEMETSNDKLTIVDDVDREAKILVFMENNDCTREEAEALFESVKKVKQELSKNYVN